MLGSSKGRETLLLIILGIFVACILAMHLLTPRLELIEKERACIESGGRVAYTLCHCPGVEDFPNTCLEGFCSCEPSGEARKIMVCECGEEMCFDGEKCVERKIPSPSRETTNESLERILKGLVKEKLPTVELVDREQSYYLGCKVKIFATYVYPHTIAGPAVETMYFGILECSPSVEALTLEEFAERLEAAKKEKYPYIQSEIVRKGFEKVIHEHYFVTLREDSRVKQVYYEGYVFRLKGKYVICGYRDEGTVEKIGLEKFLEVVGCLLENG